MTSRRKPTGSPRPARPRRPAVPPLPDRRLMEQQMATLGRLLEGREFGSIEEANAFLHDLLRQTGGALPAPAPDTPLEQAQELVYRALEATGPRRLKLAHQALAISADCADAYVLLAEATADPRAARRLYEQGVRAGERALGPEVFTEGVGHFWGILETRPYMRARQGLADVLWVLGERRAAIGHLREMLRLNPGDNQGLRYMLAQWLLAVGDDAALDDLWARYPDEVGADWLYTRALALFRRSGAGRRADAALERALGANPFVPPYLLGARPLPKRLPAYVGLGDEDEAVAYLAEGGVAWLDTPGAPEWLAAALRRRLTPSKVVRFPRPRRR